MKKMKNEHEYNESIRRNCRIHWAGTTPNRVITYQPSEAAKARVADIIYREKTPA